jgi:hypothetical protein
MGRAGRICFALILSFVLLGSGDAFAQNGIFNSSGDQDIAQAWLDLIFRGISLPAALASEAPNLDAVAAQKLIASLLQRERFILFDFLFLNSLYLN